MVIIGSALPALVVFLHVGYARLGALAGSVYIGEFFGAYIFGWISEKYGRKWGFIGAVLQYSIFVIATGLAWNYSSVYAFRLISGFGLGGEVPIAASLVSEFASSVKRGFIVLVYEILYAWALLIGPLSAALIYSLVGEAIGWRVLFYLGVIPLVAGVVSIFALWESPRWLINHGRLEEARAILAKLGRTGAKNQDASITEVDRAIDESDTAPKKTQWFELFSKKYLGERGSYGRFGSPDTLCSTAFSYGYPPNMRGSVVSLCHCLWK